MTTASVATLETATLTQWSATREEPLWLQLWRGEQWNAALQTPPPAKTLEAWKYTNLEKLAGWDTAIWNPSALTMTRSALDAESQKRGVICADLHAALAQYPTLVARYLRQGSDVGASERHDFSGLSGGAYGGSKYVQQHNALFGSGTFIYVPADVTLATPIHLTHAIRQAGSAVFPRTIIVLERGASAIIVEEFQSDALTKNDLATCHAYTTITTHEGAIAQHIAIQRQQENVRHVAHQHAIVAAHARCTTTNLTLGARMHKSMTETQLIGAGAESFLFGLAFGGGAQHLDHHTIQTHLAPQTTSDLLYKTALKDSSRSAFTGLIRMTHAAQQGQAYQQSRNLLLSEHAQANAVPQLEIEANDVKCSHGASLGPIDPEQCYYLASRGLTPADAETIVVSGFFEELLARIPDGHAAEIARNAIWKKLGGTGDERAALALALE